MMSDARKYNCRTRKVSCCKCGVLESEVILIKEKEDKRWLYLDVGRYSGLAETEGEAIKYKIEFSRKNKEKS